VLIAGADDPLAAAVCGALVGAEYQVRLTHEEPLGWVEEGGPWVQFFESRLQDEVATDVLLKTCSTLVVFPRRGGDSWLDYDTRCLFNLLQSASYAARLCPRPPSDPRGPVTLILTCCIWLADCVCFAALQPREAHHERAGRCSERRRHPVKGHPGVYRRPR
jgi:hypothetical protein